MAMSAEGIEVVNCVLLTKVVVRLPPFHCTTDPDTKFEPFTVSVKPAPPAVVLLGEIELIVGTGLPAGSSDVEALPPPPHAARLRLRAKFAKIRRKHFPETIGTPSRISR